PTAAPSGYARAHRLERPGGRQPQRRNLRRPARALGGTAAAPALRGNYLSAAKSDDKAEEIGDGADSRACAGNPGGRRRGGAVSAEPPSPRHRAAGGGAATTAAAAGAAAGGAQRAGAGRRWQRADAHSGAGR